jgi:hypothetical protein
VTSEEAALAVIDALERNGISYMVVGSLSSSYYGIPRLTKDADFVIQFDTHFIPSLVNSLGPTFRLDPQMAFEMVMGTTKNVLDLADSPLQVELFHLSDDPHDQQRFLRRQRVRLLGREAFLPSVEDVIITKLRWAVQARRSKDWDDVRGVIAVQRDRIDWDYVYSWCDRHGTREALDEVRRSIPPL